VKLESSAGRVAYSRNLKKLWAKGQRDSRVKMVPDSVLDHIDMII
jgi:phosphoribosyl-AMP cyclohydrolase